jgi:hypothetical protein
MIFLTPQFALFWLLLWRIKNHYTVVYVSCCIVNHGASLLFFFYNNYTLILLFIYFNVNLEFIESATTNDFFLSTKYH